MVVFPVRAVGASVVRLKKERKVKSIDFAPKNDEQIAYVNSILYNDITICLGPPGVGKTACCVGTALSLYFSGEMEKVLISRPTVVQGKDIGFLPGDISSKVDPFLTPIYDELKKYINVSDLVSFIGVSSYKSNPKIEIAPIQFLQGRTLNNSLLIIDEAQLCTYEQLRTIITRIGLGAKIVLNGDTRQDDPLEDIATKLSNIDRIGIVRMKETQRHPLISVMLDRL